MWKGNVVRSIRAGQPLAFRGSVVPFDAIMMEGHAQHRSPTMPVKGLLFRENSRTSRRIPHAQATQFVITISVQSRSHVGAARAYSVRATCCLPRI